MKQYFKMYWWIGFLSCLAGCGFILKVYFSLLALGRERSAAFNEGIRDLGRESGSGLSGDLVVDLFFNLEGFITQNHNDILISLFLS